MSRTILIPFVALFFLRLLIAAVFPVFGDEAYYVYWGSHPGGGFYDLPPMIGWWLAPLLKASFHPLWLRLWNLLVPVLIAFGIFEWLLNDRGRESAGVAAVTFFVLPLPFLTVISFPDVPLLFFGFFSALLFHSGVLSQRNFLSPTIAMAGALFGAAFLSKYFAIFLLPAFAVWAWPRAKRRGGAILSFFVGSFPFLFQHFFWNEQNCRANAVFNLVTRQRVYEGSPFETTGILFLHLLVVSFTVVPFFRRSAGKKDSSSGGLRSFLFLLWFMPVLVFAGTALLGRGQGLHWLLFLTPFFLAWTSFSLPSGRLKGAFFTSAFFSGILGGILLLAFLMPERVIPSRVRDRYSFEFGVITGAKDFVTQLKSQIDGSSALLFESYGLASLVHYEFGRHRGQDLIPDFGVVTSGSRFGRVFDFTTDWNALQGKKISMIKTGSFDSAKYAPYFADLEGKNVFFRGAEYSVLTGSGFDSRKFWFEQVLPELEQFYPQEFSGKCALKEVFRAN
jgi:hypothetical protein